MEPNENGASTPTQRLLIGAGTLIVVILTLVGAIFLAMQDIPDETPIEPSQQPVAQISPTTGIIVTNTPMPSPSFTPLPSDTPTPPVTPSATVALIEPTEPPPVDTDTPVPVPPTATPLPIVEEQPTATLTLPLPSATPSQVVEPLTVCEPPVSWVTYQVEVGDTLNNLAVRTNTSVNDLVQVNCLETFTVRPGDILNLPFIPPTPTPTYTPGPTRTTRPTRTRTATPIAPRIGNVTVNTDIANNLVTVFVTGENFRSQEQGFRAELAGLTTIPLQLGQARTSTSFEATAPLDQLDLGEYDLVVINPNGRLDIRENVWPPTNSTATPTPAPPEITRVSPSSGQVSVDVRLTIQGRNFLPLESGFRVELRLEDGSRTVELIVDQGVRPATSTSFDVLVFSGSLVGGDYDLLVTNPDGRTDIERFAYQAIE